MKKVIVSLFALILPCIFPLQSLAQNISTSDCLDEVYTAIAREQRLYRAVVFGQNTASRLPQGSTQYDGDGNAWIKTGENQWKSYAGSNPKDNFEMDMARESDPLCQSSQSDIQRGCVTMPR